MSGTTLYQLHGRLLRDTFGRHISDEDAFLIFVLFHSYQILLSGPILTDRPGGRGVVGLTQRSVSQALASVWKGTQDVRASRHYWYERWNGEWGSYGHAENLTPAEQERLQQLKAQLESHPFVMRLEPED